MKNKGIMDDIIDSLVAKRLLNNVVIKSNTAEYDKREEELILLSNNIRAKMGSERSLFMRYEELSTLSENALLNDTYKQGITDGIELLLTILRI